MKYSSSMLKTCAYFGIVAMVAVFVMSFQPMQTQAAAPLKGTMIGNQAAATYTDASNAGRTATSNTVNTIVLHVPDFTIIANQSKTVSPGGTVYFGHTVTITGNGSDTISLTSVDASTGNINFVGAIKMYIDANGDGLPDNATVISSTGSLSAGASFSFVVAATVPGTAANTDADTLTITGTSVTDGLVTKSNTDTVIVSTAAVVQLTKSQSVASGAPGTAITYTFTYTNSGNATATNVTIEDILDANLVYTTGNKARWSVTGATALTDASDGVQGTAPTIDYYTYATNTKIWARINTLGAGQSGTLSFVVSAKPGIAPGFIPNSGTVSYIDGVGSTPVQNPSNTVNFQVLQGAAVVLYDTGSTTDGDGTPNDIIFKGKATQGGTIGFDNVIHNTGNGTDTFNITFSGSNYPAGTSFLLFKADNVSPLVDTNGDNIADTGPVAAGGVYHVFMQITLPANASGGGAYNVTKTATSVLDPTQSDTTTDRLGTITPNTVDLTNNTAIVSSTPAGTAAIGTALTDGYGAASGNSNATVITTNATDPATSTTFKLYVNNTSAVPDSFDLLADKDGAFASANDLQANWIVDFKLDASAGACTTTGASISNTGTINAGANVLVCAIVTVPAGQAPATYDMYFEAKSPSSGALDTKRDAVKVNTVRSIQITSNNAGQIFPGGSIVYTHIIANAGNVAEGTLSTPVDPGSTITLTLADSLSAQGWTSVIYWDKNNDGILDNLDPVASTLDAFTGGSASADAVNAGLAVGEQATLFVKVFAPLGAAINAINTSTVTVTTTGTVTTIAAPPAVTNDDNTTVIAGQVRLVKKQALDITCDGLADGVFTTTDQSAKPGACIIYQVVATNDGTADVTTLVLSDSTPANTTYHDINTAACGAAGTPETLPAATTVRSDGGALGGATAISAVCGNAATITSNIGSLAPAGSATLTFSVRINP